MSLHDVGRKNFTEKTTHGYLDIYESLWKHLQHEPITLLEIGVYNGNSMRTWCEWFTKATIVGIDKHSAPRATESCAKLYFGDQADSYFLEKVIKSYEGFDIVIDDGGHKWKEQQISFKYLWPAVKSKGMYIIEDLHTSNDAFWSEGWRTNTIDYLKNYINEVVLDNGVDIQSIQFYNKLCVLVKK